jgi:predicted ArsR family transcriptional regulator
MVFTRGRPLRFYRLTDSDRTDRRDPLTFSILALVGAHIRVHIGPSSSSGSRSDTSVATRARARARARSYSPRIAPMYRSEFPRNNNFLAMIYRRSHAHAMARANRSHRACARARTSLLLRTLCPSTSVAFTRVLAGNFRNPRNFRSGTLRKCTKNILKKELLCQSIRWLNMA